ncbi:hypothetical protein D3C84_504040 [compost metagenome]
MVPKTYLVSILEASLIHLLSFPLTIPSLKFPPIPGMYIANSGKSPVSTLKPVFEPYKARLNFRVPFFNTKLFPSGA